MTAVKLHTRVFALLAAVALVVSFCPPPSQAAGKLNVMTATTDLAALAQEIGGDKVDVESIARGYQDPHFVEAKPSFLLKLRRADLLIVVGLELEIGWLPPLITQSTNPKIEVELRLSGCLALCEKFWKSPTGYNHSAPKARPPAQIRNTASIRKMVCIAKGAIRQIQ
jgi:ABC-type Zn uptake system ZnuABC Zn-binding protein ZnuA